MANTPELRFVDTIEAAEFLARDVAAAQSRLNGWFERLSAELDAMRLASGGLRGDHPLAVRAGAIDARLRETRERWARQREALKPAQALADLLDDKVILLVFGKFNAGKSSFCNFLAQRFALHGRPLRYFRVEGGRVAEIADGFREGATETTAQLQGVVLGENLVLLDTPGMHSVTPENAALTQRYTDSADGVLWLTSSTSPGQVQELDELARELRRNKPLLPVVTRSDVIEEDEVDGEIRKRLRNKTPENRAVQESDVHARAARKLELMGVAPCALRQPVSISCHAARQEGLEREALRDAGFDRLYEALLNIVGPALQYKQRQPVEMLFHHLDENVCGALAGEILPSLDELMADLDDQKAALVRRKAQAANAMWRGVIPVLPALLEAHVESTDPRGLCDAVSQRLLEVAGTEIPQSFAGHVLAMDAAPVEIGPPGSAAGPSAYERLYAALEASVGAAVENLAGDALDQCLGHVDELAQGARNAQDRLRACLDGLAQMRLDPAREDIVS